MAAAPVKVDGGGVVPVAVALPAGLVGAGLLAAADELGVDGALPEGAEEGAADKGAAEELLPPPGAAGQLLVSLNELIPPLRAVAMPEDNVEATDCRACGTLEVMASARACEAVNCSWRLLRTSAALPAAAKAHFFPVKSLITPSVAVWRPWIGVVSWRASFWLRSEEPLAVLTPAWISERRVFPAERTAPASPLVYELMAAKIYLRTKY